MHHLVKDLMSRDVVTVDARAPFRELVALLDRHRVSALPVVDERGRPVGVVSSSDLVLKQDLDGRGAWLAGGRRRRELAKAAATTAGALMTTPTVTVGVHQTVAEAANLLHCFSINHLPVVDGEGRLVGIVSRGDLLRVFLRTDDDIRREVVEEVLGQPHVPEAAEIQVGVAGGVVRLDGSVERHSDLEQVVDLVRAVDGVVGVESRLTCRVRDGAAPLRLVR